MAKLRRVIIGKQCTINLGDFSNVKPSIELEAELDEDDDYQEVRQWLMQMIDEHLKEEIDQHT